MGVKRVNKPILKFQMPQGIAGRGGGGMVEEEGEILKLQMDWYIQFVRVGKGGGEEEENLKFLGSQKGAYLLQLFWMIELRKGQDKWQNENLFL